MWSPFGPYGTVMIFILASTIPLRNLLSRDEKSERLPLSELPSEIRSKGYQWHISLYLLMYLYKLVIDLHNEPIKARVGGYTHLVHSIEGDFSMWAQDLFRNDLLTDLLSFHYLFVYLLIIWFVPVYFILVKDQVMADKAALNYFVMYVLAVPLYLFFNVEVTSSFIPGMDALLYHDSWFMEFFTNNDPLDNGFPSLHFGLPVGFLILNRLHCRDLGISIREWRHRELDLFVMANVVIYFFSIQYLGIHWVIDIIPGLVLAVVCATFCHKWQPKLRSRPQKGWESILPSRKGASIAIVFTILCTSAIVSVIIDGSGSEKQNPNFRFGQGDVAIDIVEVHSLSHPVIVEIINVGEYPVNVVIVDRDHVIPHVDRGNVDWSAIVAGSDLNPDFSAVTLEQGDSWTTEVSTSSLSDVHLVLAKLTGTEQGEGEVRITMEYFDDELMWTAVLASLPAFFITGLAMVIFSGDLDYIVGKDSAHVDP
ncbi:MAG: hypothetical protein CMA21_02470 [Euryarchaeota archaeon]|nr:hypothetical protein [Euryarchaeota archaeon]|tara:strand:+ start:5545 stop:6987 length:1443 start_codon:yes stop_codon:yes gene_type:complete